MAAKFLEHLHSELCEPEKNEKEKHSAAFGSKVPRGTGKGCAPGSVEDHVTGAGKPAYCTKEKKQHSSLSFLACPLQHISKMESLYIHGTMHTGAHSHMQAHTHTRTSE